MPGVMRRVTRTVTSAPVTDTAMLLTSAEAARLLRVSVDTLLKLDIPWVPIGAGRKRPHRRYRPEALNEWCRRREAAS